MNKKILVDASYKDEVQVAIVKDNKLEDFEYSTRHRQTIKGNIYLAKVTRVEPSLQAAFIDYGGNRHGFVPFSEIHTDYYNIPVEDRQRLKEQNKREIQEVKEHGHKKLKALRKSDHVEEAVIDDEDGDLAFDSAINEIQEEEAADIPALDENYFERIKQKNVSRYKVQEVIKKGQVLLVQAIKEERGNKGAAFTTYLSLAGRYCVLMPNSDSIGGISRKITKVENRKRLKSIVDQLSPGEGASVIVRTIGQSKSAEEIKSDYDYLVNLWNTIREKTLASMAPEFIYAEDDILKQVIRDLYDDETKEIIVDGKEAFLKMKQIASSISSVGGIKIEEHKKNTPVFNAFSINQQILDLYGTNVEMDSGAYIVINHTEALVAIDVNSGKLTSERNVEETAIKTNIEAAKEIARQIRLRDLSGLIVIDFIDMIEPKNRRHIERILREELLKDKAKVQVGHISNFGLLEMSRQRMKPSFLEHNTVICNHCRGKGTTRSYESCAVTILKTIEGEISGQKVGEVVIYAAPDTVLYTLNNKRSDLIEIEKKHDVKVTLMQDSRMSAESFAIEKKKNAKEVSAEKVSDEINSEVASLTSPEPDGKKVKKPKNKKRSNTQSANSKQKSQQDGDE